MSQAAHARLAWAALQSSPTTHQAPARLTTHCYHYSRQCLLWPVHAWAARLRHNRTQAPLPPRLHTLHSVCSVDHSPYLISLHQGVGHTPCTRPRRPSHTVCICPEVVGNIITYHTPCLREGQRGTQLSKLHSVRLPLIQHPKVTTK